MADLTKTVEIIFGAVDNTSTGLSTINSSVDKFAANTSKITAPLADIATEVEATTVALGALGVALLAVSTKNYADFESASLDLVRVIDPANEKIGELQQKALELSDQFGASTTEILKGIISFKQAGFTAKEAADLQTEALRLMVAGDLSAAEATDTLIRSIIGFGVEASNAPRFSEALNNVADKYAVNVQQIATNTQTLAPIAKQLGFSFEETVGILTPVVEQFGKGNEAADGLRTGLLKLTDNSKPVLDVLQKLGVSQTDVNGKMRSGKDIFFDVANALQNVDANQRAVYIQNLAGIEQAPKLSIAFNEIVKVQEATATAYAKTGSVQRELDTQMKSLEFAAKQNAAAWENLTIVVGEKYSTGTLKATQGLRSLGNTLRTAVEAGSFDPILNEINAVNLGFGLFIEKVAKSLPDALEFVDFSGLIGSFNDLEMSFGGIFDDIDLTTPEGLAKAIQFVVDSVESLIRVTDGIVSAWSPVINTFLVGVDSFNGLDESTKKYIGTALGVSQVFETLKGAILGGVGALDSIASTFESLVEVLETASITKLSLSFADLFTKTKAVGGALGAAGLAGAAAAAGVAIGTDLKGEIDELLSTLTGSKTTLGAWIYDVTHSGEESEKAAGSVRHFSGSFEEISKSTGVSVKSLYELDKAVRDGVLSFDSATGTYKKAGEGVRSYGEATKATAITQSEWEKSVNSVSNSLIKVKSGAENVIGTFKSLTEAEAEGWKEVAKGNTTNIAYVDGLYQLTVVNKKATETGKEVAKTAEQIANETGKLTEKQRLAIEQTNKLELQLNELASNERIKFMEFEANIKVASIQADAQQVVAAFNEIGVAIQATQQAQAEIFGSLVEGLTSGNLRTLDKWFLQDFALEQQRQAQQALDDQSRLIDAQVASMNARTQALLNGGGLINVNADNLAPELQMVLRSLLEHIQIEANAEGLELLL